MSANRAPSHDDFSVEVEGIGNFTFGNRILRDEMRIAAELSRLTEGVETPTVWLENVSRWVSTLKVMVVSAPKGWDIDAMDPLDEGTYDRLFRVYSALRTKESSFRKKPAAPSEGGGSGTGGSA